MIGIWSWGGNERWGSGVGPIQFRCGHMLQFTNELTKQSKLSYDSICA